MDSGSGWLELSLAPIVLAVTTRSRSDARARPVRFGFPDSYVASAFRSFSGSVTYCRRIETRTRLKLLRPARPAGGRSHVELRHASALWRGVVPGSARADRCEQRGGGRVTVMVRSHWWESRGYPELRPGVRTQRQQRRARPRGPSAHPVTPARTRRGDEPTGFTGTRRQLNAGSGHRRGRSGEPPEHIR